MAARADGHAWRKRSGAVLTGIGTALSDDPRLDVRLVPTQVQPLRVVLDSHLALPVNARLLDPPGHVLVVTVDDDPAKCAALGKDNVQVLRLPAIGGKVDLDALMVELAGRDVNELHVEAGAMLNGALLQSGLVDELLVYMAPLLIGQGRDLAAFGPLTALSNAPAFRIQSVMQLDEDLRIIARRRDTEPDQGRQLNVGPTWRTLVQRVGEPYNPLSLQRPETLQSVDLPRISRNGMSLAFLRLESVFANTTRSQEHRDAVQFARANCHNAVHRMCRKHGSGGSNHLFR